MHRVRNTFALRRSVASSLKMPHHVAAARRTAEKIVFLDHPQDLKKRRSRAAVGILADGLPQALLLPGGKQELAEEHVKLRAVGLHNGAHQGHGHADVVIFARQCLLRGLDGSRVSDAQICCQNIIGAGWLIVSLEVPQLLGKRVPNVVRRADPVLGKNAPRGQHPQRPVKLGSDLPAAEAASAAADGILKLCQPVGRRIVERLRVLRDVELHQRRNVLLEVLRHGKPRRGMGAQKRLQRLKAHRIDALLTKLGHQSFQLRIQKEKLHAVLREPAAFQLILKRMAGKKIIAHAHHILPARNVSRTNARLLPSCTGTTSSKSRSRVPSRNTA